MISTSLREEWFSTPQKNLLAGLTTAFALVPECIAFALVAQLNPLMGLYGAFIICTLTAIFGGRPSMISGAAGSMAVVIVALVAQHGVQYLLATVVLCGIVIAALSFAWQHALEMRADVDDSEAGVRTYRPHGTLFFASAAHFQELFAPSTDPARVVLDCRHLHMADHSAIAAMESLYERYERRVSTCK